jgi:AAA domain
MNESPEDFLDRRGFTELPPIQINDEIPWLDDDEQAPPPVLEALDVGDDDQPLPPRQWLLGNTFCRQFVSGAIASGAGGKTSLRIVQALSVSSGRPLSGEHVFKRANVLIVCLEDGMIELRRRLRAAMKHHGVAHDEVKGRLLLATPTGMKMAQYGAKRSVVRGDLDRAIRSFIDDRKIDLVIIDPIKKAHSLDENDNHDMDAVVTILAQLAIDKNIAVDVLSHERKAAGAAAGDANRARGASALKDGGRLMYTLTGMTEAERDAFNLTEEERRLLFRVDSAKVNLAPPSASAQWFRLVGVRLDNGDDTYPNGDEVQTVERWAPPRLFEGFSTADLNKALDRLRAGMGDGRLYSVAPSAKDRAAWRVLQDVCPGQSEKPCRKIIATWVKNKVLTIGEYYDEKERKRFEGITGAKLVGVEIAP